MNKVTIDNKKIAYFHTGVRNKPKLVLLHPLFGNSRYYEQSIKFLKNKFDILAPDFPGFGLSDKYKNKKHTVENYCITVHKLCKYCGFDNFYLAGSSLGAMTSIAFTSKYPKMVIKLFIQAPPWQKECYDLNFKEKAIAFASEYEFIVKLADKAFKRLKLKFSNKTITDLLKYLERFYVEVEKKTGVITYFIRTMDLIAAAQIWNNIKDINLEDEAGKITQKTMIVVGDQDHSVKPESLEKLSLIMHNSEFIIIKGGLHALFLQHPERMAIMMRKFFLNH